MMSFLYSALAKLKKHKLITLATTITLVFITMLNFGITYQQVHAKGTIDIHFSQKNDAQFISALRDFAEEEQLIFNNGTREYYSGAKTVLLELMTENGKKVLKANDYMDSTRFVVSAYENDKRDWEPLFDACFKFLQMRFTDAKFEKKLLDVSD